MTSQAIAQIGIVIFGMTAVFLVNDHRQSVAKWGPVCGLAAQPFWFYTAFTNDQWGIFACSFVYAASWARGYYNSWWRVQDTGPTPSMIEAGRKALNESDSGFWSRGGTAESVLLSRIFTAMRGTK